MSVFFLTLILLIVAMAGLAVGVIVRGKQLQPSCGGNAIMQLCRACESLNKR
ncbi:MAG: hypothetical protein HQ483_03590 [Rhodospirillales bacterium]|nr:hypothetical protein [Rhodospirillales bacterium]